MVIDIDSFLDKYKDDGTSKNKQKDNIDLNFQKEVEEKVQNVEKEGLNKDFDFLKKVYDEIKKFDEDLPNKFLGIENKGELALKNLGNKYSDEFLKKVKANGSIIEQQIRTQLIKLDESLKNQNFTTQLKEFEELLKKYELYPKQLLKERTQIYYEIKKRELKVNEEIKKFKESNLIKIKKELNSVASDLIKNLTPLNIEKIEEKIESLHFKFYSIPKVFMSDLSDEKMKISALLIKAHLFLQEQYLKDFDQRKNRILELKEKFHSFQIKNDINNVLLVYDEILYQFEKLPEVLLEKKIEVYKEINKLYSSINTLLMKDSVSRFLESYNSSKIIEESKDYVRHLKSGGKANPQNLFELKSKLSSLSEKHTTEKNQLETQINQILIAYNKYKQSPKKPNEMKFRSKAFNEETPFEQETDFENLISNKKINKNILKEINLHFEQMKLSNDSKELKLLYKKIIFYLDTLPITDNEKKLIINKVNRTINKKKLY